MLLRRFFLSAILVPLAPCTVRAAQYEVFIDVQSEDDLYDLLVTDQISQSSFDALLLLHQMRVDLNDADRQTLYLLPNLDYEHVDRILAYRSEAGSIQSLASLITSGVLEPRLVHGLRAFVALHPRRTRESGVDGLVRIQSRWSGRHDRLPPAAGLQARLTARRGLDTGLAAALTRNGFGKVRWDPGRAALSAVPERTRLEIPKLYIQWGGRHWEIIAGTYRIGFGQSLTFDVTDQVTPNGFFGDYELRRDNELRLRCRRGPGELRKSPCPAHRAPRVTPDFNWTNRLSGVAVGLRHGSLGPGWLQVYAWGSYQVHRASQFELVDASACDDPRRDGDPRCGAPSVYIRGDSPDAPQSVARLATLPAMYTEALAGIHASYFWKDRAHLGVTGYGSAPRSLVRGADLGFQELSRKPFGGPFGALGLDASFGFRAQDFSAELSRSFDAQPGGGGGYGAIVRSITTLPSLELDVSARYYGASYANPYARPISAPDELDGLRARDEAGIRVRLTAERVRGLRFQVAADLWQRLSSRLRGASFFARSDLQLGRSWAVAVWTELRGGAGRRFVLAARLSYEPLPILALATQLQHRLNGPRPAGGPVPQDISAILDLRARPARILRLHLRVRYDFQDIANRNRLPETLWTYLDAALTARGRDTLRLRYDFRIFLDRRESTAVRAPNPEHWIWLEYVFRY